MSRVAKAPVTIPAGVEVKIAAGKIAIKGKQGQLELDVHSDVEIKQEENVLTFAPRTGEKTSQRPGRYFPCPGKQHGYRCDRWL